MDLLKSLTSNLSSPLLEIAEIKQNPWDFFRRKYVINLERMPERRVRAEKHLKSLALDVSFFNAYDASKNYDLLKEQALRNKIVTENCVKEIGKGALGCLMSHYKLWESEFLKMKKGESYWILIMEDDVLFHPKFNHTVLQSYLNAMPSDAKFVKLGWMFNAYWHSKNVVPCNDLYVKFINNGVSSHICYAVHSSILETLLLKTYEHAIDDFSIEGSYGFKHLVDDPSFYKALNYKDVDYKGVCAETKEGSSTLE